jgi:hypothetical protein
VPTRFGFEDGFELDSGRCQSPGQLVEELLLDPGVVGFELRRQASHKTELDTRLVPDGFEAEQDTLNFILSSFYGPIQVDEPFPPANGS